jgi:hypothetical protein
MAEIVNLRNARKQAKRRLEEKQADAARASHGLSKVDRARAKHETAKLRREIDGHRIETGESDEIAGR